MARARVRRLGVIGVRKRAMGGIVVVRAGAATYGAWRGCSMLARQKQRARQLRKSVSL